MTVRLDIYYSSAEHSDLCFRHAVVLAQKGVDIITECASLDSEYGPVSSKCKLCDKERAVEEFAREVVGSIEDALKPFVPTGTARIAPFPASSSGLMDQLD